MLFETNKDKGRAGLALAIAYFGANGYTVNAPLNDTQWYDLVIEKDNIFQTVQCKATGSKSHQISLRNCGGTAGTAYDSVLNHPVDILFCLDEHQHMFVIPMKDILESGNMNVITLYADPPSKGAAAKLKLDTSKYLVTI